MLAVMSSSLRNLPSVERVLASEPLKALSCDFGHDLLVGVVRECVQEARVGALNGKGVPGLGQIAEEAAERLRMMGRIHPTPVINATGVVIHTNLGRAPLSDAAVAAMDDAAIGYSNLEIRPGVGASGIKAGAIFKSC